MILAKTFQLFYNFKGHSGLMTCGFIICMTSMGFILWGRSYNDSKWPVIPSSIRHAVNKYIEQYMHV